MTTQPVISGKEAISLSINDIDTLIERTLLQVDDAILADELALVSEVLFKLIMIAPDDAQVNFELGLAILFESYEQALPYFEKAEYLAPETYGLQEFLRKIKRILIEEDEAYRAVLFGQALGSIDEWGWAEIAFEEAILLDGSYAEGWAFLGKAQEMNGSDGIEALKKAYALEPSSLSTLVFLGNYYMRHNEPQKGVDFYTLAIEEDSQAPALLISLANATVQTGDLASAVNIFETGLVDFPDSLILRRNYVDFLLFYELYLTERALPVIEELISMGDYAMATNLYKGRVLLALNELENAKIYLQNVVDFEPENIEALFYYGLCLLQMGDEAGAVSSFENALELDKDNPFRLQIERLLENK